MFGFKTTCPALDLWKLARSYNIVQISKKLAPLIISKQWWMCLNGMQPVISLDIKVLNPPAAWAYTRRHVFFIPLHTDLIPSSNVVFCMRDVCVWTSGRTWGQQGAHLGPAGPRWAPCWPHEPCYLGCKSNLQQWRSASEIFPKSLHWYYIHWVAATHFPQNTHKVYHIYIQHVRKGRYVACFVSSEPQLLYLFLSCRRYMTKFDHCKHDDIMACAVLQPLVEGNPLVTSIPLPKDQ